MTCVAEKFSNVFGSLRVLHLSILLLYPLALRKFPQRMTWLHICIYGKYWMIKHSDSPVHLYAAHAVKHLSKARHNSCPKHSCTYTNKTHTVSLYLSEYRCVCQLVCLSVSLPHTSTPTQICPQTYSIWHLQRARSRQKYKMLNLRVR